MALKKNWPELTIEKYIKEKTLKRINRELWTGN
jgi:hypothetical protein